MPQYISSSEEETYQLGVAFGKTLRIPEIVRFYGDLGSGKTVFIRGVCAALGVAERMVRSPSYTLVNRYPGDVTVYHVDLYRLQTAEDLAGIGLEEIMEENAVVLVEWAERAGESGQRRAASDSRRCATGSGRVCPASTAR